MCFSSLNDLKCHKQKDNIEDKLLQYYMFDYNIYIYNMYNSYNSYNSLYIT